IEEMCRSLMEGKALAREAGEAVVADSAGMAQLPDTVQAVIGTRIDRLEPAVRDVLKVASIIGTDFRRSILDMVVEQKSDVPRAIELLKSAGLIQQTAVVPRAEYRFRHVLTQEVAYGSLLEHQRSALHSRIGHAIERSEPDRLNEQADVLARHFSRAREWEPAIKYAFTAAERATRVNQFRQSLAILDAAHEWVFQLDAGPSRDELLAEVLFRQERTCETLGLRERQHQLVETLIDLLQRRSESEKLADAYLRQGELYTLLRQFQLAAQALEKSLQLARDRDDAVAERNALRSLGFMSWQQGDFDQALVRVHGALEIDRRRGDQEAIAGDLNNLGRIYKGAGDYDAALECLEESMRLVVERGDRVHQAYTHNAIGQVHRARGDLVKALDHLQQAEESARLQGLTIQRSFNMTSVARVLFQLGHADASIAKYQEAIDLCQRAGYAPGLAQSLRLCGDLMVDLRRDSEAVERLTEAAGLFRQLEDSETEGEIMTQLAAALERLGRWDDAVRTWESVRGLPRSIGGIQAELNAVEGMARASRFAGLPRDVVVHRYEEALALGLSAGDAERTGALLNTIGILEFERARYEEAANHYRDAASVFHDIGDRIHEGLMLNSLGVTLTRLDRDDEAAAVLEDARDLNVDSGQRLLQAHSLSALAELAMRAGDFDGASSGFRESLAIRREIGDRRGEGWSLLNLARAYRALGDSGVALSLESDARSVASELHDSALEHAIAESTKSNLNISSQGD
nr:tetratricopeptide repeat protein [Gemmatimonadota bacterium]